MDCRPKVTVSAIAVVERSRLPRRCPAGESGGKSWPVRRHTTSQTTTGTAARVPHTNSERRQPSGADPAIGTDSSEPAPPPVASMTVYTVMSWTARRPPWRLTQAGTRTLPVAGPMRARAESTTKTGKEPARGRSSSPRVVTAKARTMAPVSPRRRAIGTASSTSTPKHRPGRALTTPPAVSPRPKAAVMRSIRGPGAAAPRRRFMATVSTATTASRAPTVPGQTRRGGTGSEATASGAKESGSTLIVPL